MTTEQYNVSIMEQAEIDILAELSQIELNEAECKMLSVAIDQMLAYFAVMDKFVDAEPIDGATQEHNKRENTTGILTTDREIAIPLSANAHTRERVQTEIGDYTDMAPDSESGFFIVPHVI